MASVRQIVAISPSSRPITFLRSRTMTISLNNTSVAKMIVSTMKRKIAYQNRYFPTTIRYNDTMIGDIQSRPIHYNDTSNQMDRSRPISRMYNTKVPVMQMDKFDHSSRLNVEPQLALAYDYTDYDDDDNDEVVTGQYPLIKTNQHHDEQQQAFRFTSDTSQGAGRGGGVPPLNNYVMTSSSPYPPPTCTAVAPISQQQRKSGGGGTGSGGRHQCPKVRKKVKKNKSNTTLVLMWYGLLEVAQN